MDLHSAWVFVLVGEVSVMRQSKDSTSEISTRLLTVNGKAEKRDELGDVLNNQFECLVGHPSVYKRGKVQGGRSIELSFIVNELVRSSTADTSFL